MDISLYNIIRNIVMDTHNEQYNQPPIVYTNATGYMLLGLVILIFGGYLCEIKASLSETSETITRPLNLEKQTITDCLLFGEECVICLEKYEKKDKITRLECNHLFHHKCIVVWTNQNKSCPLCRINLL